MKFFPEKNIDLQEVKKNKKIDIKILLAENNAPNSTLFIEIIKKLKFECDLAVNAKEAISLSKKNNYDLIFINCQMSGLNGISVARTIRNFYEDANKQVCIIALTEFAADEDIKNTISSGIDDFITKPFNISKLKYVVTKYSKRIKNKNTSKKTVKNYEECINDFMIESELDRHTCERLVELFKNNAENLLKLIIKNIKDKKNHEAAFLLHKLKGSSANVRAHNIFKSIETAEKALKNNDSKNALHYIKNAFEQLNDFHC